MCKVLEFCQPHPLVQPTQMEWKYVEILSLQKISGMFWFQLIQKYKHIADLSLKFSTIQEKEKNQYFG